MNLQNDVILTGVPRSGTTLACRLLSQFTQTVALNEPLDRTLFDSPEDAVKNIAAKFGEFRKSLIENGKAIARTKSGTITDNAFSTEEGSKRERVIERTEIFFDKQLEKNFRLIMKHCAEFTLILPELSKHYAVYAIIRNPLATLLSWRSVDVPVSRGKVAKSGKLNKTFHEQLEAVGEDLLKRQLFILSWYYEQYKSVPESHILRYEEFIKDPETTFQNISEGKFISKNETLKSKNTGFVTANAESRSIAEALVNYDGAFWNYYNREQVLELIKGN